MRSKYLLPQCCCPKCGGQSFSQLTAARRPRYDSEGNPAALCVRCGLLSRVIWWRLRGAGALGTWFRAAARMSDRPTKAVPRRGRRRELDFNEGPFDGVKVVMVGRASV